jgi:clan AA aspartic protease
MITGVVTPGRDATIALDVRSANAQQATVTAIVDTGFTGYLTLPTALMASLAFPRIGVRPATLADGSQVNLEIYDATLLWDGQILNILALAAGGDPLVGMALLYGHTLTIQVVDGGGVTIEALP